MAYNEKLADKIREALANHDLPDIEEKKMFRGICFMVNGKMCVCASGDEMLCRIGPEYKDALEKHGVRGMIRNGKALKDFIFVSEDAMKTKKEFDSWINKALAFNKFAKATKK
ncbi:TfoX/Sxy family protein [Mucilaginibacter sp.]|uniref:TfoX/Sxy family protein n=1 Tax=Mucilaginibacter sp. TaxID=1882438 RepID=UPI0026349D29|nr:TfoX/Sxy family protein [Mucilaginibacter sp.]MDB4927218.1 TfoX family protein [Mucilaginibacter sp.]